MTLSGGSAQGSGEPSDLSTKRGLHGFPLVLVVVLAFVATLVLYAFAVGSAHRLNSAHSRLGVYSIDHGHVGFRYFICPGETVNYVELTVAHNTEAQRVWIVNDPDPVAVVAGMPVPVDLEAGRDYEVAVRVGRREAGQEFKPGSPPPFGQVLVRGKVRDTARFEETAAASCGKP